MTRKDVKGDQPSGGETTWTNTGATRYGRGQHKTGSFGDDMLRPSPNHGTQRLPNDDDDENALLDGFTRPTVHLGLVITRPRCTEYDRASISFRRYCADSARRKSPHAQVSSRVIGQVVLRSELRCAAATHWSRHGQYMERGVKLQTKTAAYYYR